MTWTPGDETERLDLDVLQNCLDNVTDERWVDAFLGHFGPLFRLWIREVLRIASQEDWKDVYQSVLEKLFIRDALSKYHRERGSPKRYLRQVVRNVARDYYRRQAGGALALEYEDSLADEAAILADQSPPKSVEQLIEAISNHLDRADLQGQRLEIYKAFLDLHPPRQIAEQYDVSLATVYRYRADLLEIAKAVLGVKSTEKNLPGPENPGG